jgi:hypothetical protein
MTAPAAECCCAQGPATAAFFAPSEACHARRFRQRAIKMPAAHINLDQCIEHRSVPGTLRQMQPWQAFFRKYVPRRFKPRGLIERANMKMRFSRALPFARQSGPAPCAEAAPPAGGRIELRYLPFGYRISVAIESHEHGDGRTTVPPTALAMAPRHPSRFTGGNKSHCAAQAPALNFIAHLFANPPLGANRSVVGRGMPAF